MPKYENLKLKMLLDSNRDKKFVKRILEPKKYGILKNPDGSHSTHSMAWGESDGKYRVYPTVVQDEKGQLKRLSGDEAWKYAKDNRESIEFNNPEEAEWFSKNYKKYWEQSDDKK